MTALTTWTGGDKEAAKAELAHWKDALKTDERAVDSLIESLEAKAKGSRGKRRADIERELKYVIGHKDKMAYPSLIARNRPIGSGVQEAASKTLVASRMKRSGMSWRMTGGQGILTLRSMEQSQRYTGAWSALRLTLRTPVAIDPDRTRKRPARLDLARW